MVELVETTQQLRANIDYFENAASTNSRDYRSHILRGTCFVAYRYGAETHFAPSRFLGYRDNSFEEHILNNAKDGRETNPAISRLIGSPPSENGDLEQEYRRFCSGLNLEPRSKGSFGVERRYWDWR